MNCLICGTESKEIETMLGTTVTICPNDDDDCMVHILGEDGGVKSAISRE